MFRYLDNLCKKDKVVEAFYVACFVGVIIFLYYGMITSAGRLEG